MFRLALEVAGLEGREAVFADAEDASTFAEPTFDGIQFREQIDYLRQKRGKPTRAWTDAMAGDHDRSFVVAGVTDLAMLEDFHAAVIEGARSYDIKPFAAEFDRLVETYGWDYTGGRNWRIRTIFETNIRTSYMAGRLKQMRDPAVVKERPYWQYLHADTRVPLESRPEHVAWDGLVLMWDDLWWDVHFPPNDWLCSCGIRTLSRRDLERLGKTGPDTAPEVARRPYTHRASGQTVMQPEGVGFGWDHMPGDLWERGLVPSRLQEAAGENSGDPYLVQIDTPEPPATLQAAARPFLAAPLPVGGQPEDYAQGFLEPFGAEVGRAVLWQDRTGARLVISDQLFRDAAGNWLPEEVLRQAPRFAELLDDPDEIWLGLRAARQPGSGSAEAAVTRRYIRAGAGEDLVAAFDIGRRYWQATGLQRPGPEALERTRTGKLLWKRD